MFIGMTSLALVHQCRIMGTVRHPSWMYLTKCYTLGDYISLSNGDFHVLVLFVGSILGAYTLSCLRSIYTFQKAKEMSSDDEKDFITCEHCEDQRDLCDRNFLVDGRRFSIKLDETFEVDTRIPCHARIFVLDKVDFSAIDDMEVKRVYLKTEHGYTFNVKLYNGDTYTHFECKTWQGLCKTYAFEPEMVIIFDIRPEDDIEGNIDIWVDVQTPPVLPLSYFGSTKHVRRLVDRTYYFSGAELNCEEISHYVSWLEDLHTVKTNFLPALRNVSTQNVRPIVIVLNYGHIYNGKTGLPMTVVP